MKKLLLPIALLLTNTAFAANWVTLGTSSSGDYTVYIDTDSIKKVNSYGSQQVRYFAKYDYQKAQKTAEGKYYNYSITQEKADCTNEKLSLSAVALYMRNGSVLDSESYSYDKWKVVYPDSIGASELNFVCRYVGY